MEALFQRSMAVLNVVESRAPSEGSFVSEFRAVVIEARDTGNLSGMQMIARDMFEWASGLPAEARSEIQERWLEISRKC